MIWKMFLPSRPTQAVITQAATNAETGKAGSLTIPGVVSMDTKDGHLMGRDRNGNVTFIVPLPSVAAAVIDEVPRG